MSVDEIVSHMRGGEFKPNCALGASCFSSQAMMHHVHLFGVATSPTRVLGAPWLFDTGE